ncbi:RpiB/LacA/LacB family sugar-phosphate isomerase [Streptococcus pneumoniae]
MKIGVLQATTRKELNQTLFQLTKAATKDQHEMINFGVFEGEDVTVSYVEVAMWLSLLVETDAVDFVVTGCSSGQGMMLACNSLPSLSCGYLPTPQDAFLFGRINGGNVASLPLGIGTAWQGDLTLGYILEKLFNGDFGVGYPEEDAARKRTDTALLANLQARVKRSWLGLLDELDEDLLHKLLSRDNVVNHIIQEGTNTPLVQKIIEKRGTR